MPRDSPYYTLAAVKRFWSHPEANGNHFQELTAVVSFSLRAKLTEARVQVWFSNRRARLRKHLNSQQLAGLSSCVTAAGPATTGGGAHYANQYHAGATAVGDHTSVAATAVAAAAAYHSKSESSSLPSVAMATWLPDSGPLSLPTDSSSWQGATHTAGYDYSSAALGTSDPSHAIMPPAMTYPVGPMASMGHVAPSGGAMVDGAWGASGGKAMAAGWNGGMAAGFSSLGGGEQLGGLLGSQGYNMGHMTHSAMHEKGHGHPAHSYPTYFGQFADPSLMCAGRVH